MPWPCPDCGEPFVPNHMCDLLRWFLQQKNAPKSWRWLARIMMLEASAAQRAFQLEQELRVNERG